MNKNIYFVLSAFVIITILSRLTPLVYNFSPIIGLSIFGAAYIESRKLSYAVPLVLIYFTDFIINNTVFRQFFPNQDGLVWFSSYMIWGFLSYILIVTIGHWLLRKVNIKTLTISVLSSSVVFFLISNFGVWISSNGTTYSKDLTGLILCYEMAIPFFRSSLMGDMMSTAIIFGGYFILQRYAPQGAERVSIS